LTERPHMATSEREGSVTPLIYRRARVVLFKRSSLRLHAKSVVNVRTSFEAINGLLFGPLCIERQTMNVACHRQSVRDVTRPK